MKHLVTALAFSALALPAQAQDRLSVMLDWFVNPNNALIVLAQELGYFADAGLEVEIATPSDPNAPPRMGCGRPRRSGDQLSAAAASQPP